MKSKKVLIIIIVLLLLLLLATGVLAYVYLATDVLKSNSQLFSKYAGNTMNAVSELFIDENSNNIIASYENRKQTNPYEVEGTVNIKANLDDGEQTENIKIDEDIINFEGATDAKNQESERKIDINYSDDERFAFDYVRNKQLYVLGSSEVVNKFIGVENSNLKILAEKLGMKPENVPDKIEIEEYKNKLTEEQIKSLTDKYIGVIKSQLVEEDFYKEEGSQTAYILKLNGDKIKSILVKVCEELKTESIITETFTSQEELTQYQEKLDNQIKKIQERDLSDTNINITTYKTLNQVSNLQVEISYGEYVYNINVSHSNNNEITIKIKTNKSGEGQNNENEINLVLSKDVTDNSILYSISGGNGKTSVEFVIQATDILTNNVTEMIKMGFNSADSKTGILIYTNKISFKDSVDITELNSDNAVVLNAYEENYGGNVQDLYKQLLNRIDEVHKEKLAKTENGEQHGVIASIISVGENVIKSIQETLENRGSNLAEEPSIQEGLEGEETSEEQTNTEKMPTAQGQDQRNEQANIQANVEQNQIVENVEATLNSYIEGEI